ncbi:YaaL family protein [Thalassobacillus hwangdonensis]|uniref:YaaL family protein n=1 Tax=Thalassobacillus hwangdonensis TaxID=546108 RepID=A0ABW3L0A9_9BACI
MFGRKKIKKKDMDQELLADINRLQQDWSNLKNIIEHSVDPTEDGLKDLSLAKAKYFYLIKEARHRKLSALS